MGAPRVSIKPFDGLGEVKPDDALRGCVSLTGAFLVLLFVLFSFWRSCEEFEYILQSKEATALILRITNMPEEGIAKDDRPIFIRCSYLDEFYGRECTKEIIVPYRDAKSFLVGGTFQIQYLKRKMPVARQLGALRWKWPTILVGSMILLLAILLMGTRDKSWT